MADVTAAPVSTSSVEDDRSLLARLVEHGEKLIAADLPSDVRKVLGGLIHYIEAGGKFVEPEIFNPAADQAIAEEQAESARLAERLALVERQLALAAQTPAVAPAPPAPAVPAETPTPGLPGVIQAPEEAAEGDSPEVAQLKAELAAARGEAPTPPPSS